MTATQTPDFDRMSDDYERLLRELPAAVKG